MNAQESTATASMKITNFSEFENEFPKHEYLDNRNGMTLYSNGREEGSEYEVAWFCDETEQLIEFPEF